MQQPMSVSPAIFKSPLAVSAAVCLSLAAVPALGSVLFLLDPGYLAALTEKILQSGIRTYSALNIWRMIHIAISLVCFLCPVLTAAGMWTALRGQYARGLNFLSNVARWLLRFVRISAVAALAVFLFRAALYLISLSRRQDWLYQLFATLVMEGLMVVQAVFLYRLLCHFLDSCEGCAASMGYTLSSGKLDPGSIPAFAATGMLILGILGLVLSVDRVVTMTVATDGLRQFYKFLIASHPGQWLSAITLLLGGIGDILLGMYLKFYKRTSERTLFFASRQSFSS